nr:Translocon-associated protein beta (TRAPB) [uncultured bacterium]
MIVTNFTYGGDSVAAGAKFDLNFTFQNMGQVSVANMVVTVDGGESFAIAGGTNTFYFDALWAGYSLSQTVPMQALASAKSGAQPVTVSFRYEYLDSGARSSNQSDVKIAVPISQPDRFEVGDPVPSDQIVAGQETTVTLEYVNKGKGDIANVEATMEGEGFDATMKTQYVGNVASGATGSIGYAFTPTASGELNATLKVSYEDSDGQSKTKEFPVKLSVADAAPMDDPSRVDSDMNQNASQGLPWWVWAAAAAVAVAVIVGIVLLVRRHRKKKAKSEIDEEWDDWADGNADGKLDPQSGGDIASGKTVGDAADSATANNATASGDATSTSAISPSTDATPTTVIEPVNAAAEPNQIVPDDSGQSDGSAQTV